LPTTAKRKFLVHLKKEKIWDEPAQLETQKIHKKIENKLGAAQNNRVEPSQPEFLTKNREEGAQTGKREKKPCPISKKKVAICQISTSMWKK